MLKFNKFVNDFAMTFNWRNWRKINILVLFLTIANLLGKASSADTWTLDRVSDFSIYPVLLMKQEISSATKQITNQPGSTSSNNSNSNAIDHADFYFYADTRFRLAKQSVSLEVQPEFRITPTLADFWGVLVNNTTTTNRLLNLDWSIYSTRQTNIIGSLERLHFEYRTNSAQFSIGRKPVSLGVLSVFPVWNKFTRPLMTDLGPLRVVSQDQISFRYQINSWLFQGIDLEGQDASSTNAARIFEGAWYGDSFELHILGGLWWQSTTLGLAAIKDIAGNSIRFEGIHFSGHGFQAGLGAERAFDEAWSLLLEFLYLDEGASNKSQYSLLSTSPFRMLSAKAYGFGRIEYKPWPLWILQLGTLINFIDTGELLNAKAAYSVTNEIELTTELRLPLGDNTAEFSQDTLPIQIITGLRWVF